MTKHTSGQGSTLSLLRARVQSLVGELGSSKKKKRNYSRTFGEPWGREGEGKACCGLQLTNNPAGQVQDWPRKATAEIKHI